MAGPRRAGTKRAEPARGRADGERTRERILEIALPLFADHGYAGTSIRMVAQGASVNVATLAYHFSDKQGLYDAVVERLYEDIELGWPELRAAVQPGGVGPADPVERMVHTAWSFACAHRTHLRLLTRHRLDAQSLPGVVTARWSGPLLDKAEGVVALFRPGWSSVRRRMLILGTMHLVVRLVLEDPEQLRAMLGEPPDVDGAVQGWLSDWLRRELGLARGEG